ncbi:hypothetical protein JCGZ_04147 [Jatropha curcas]|uniref:Uncharacterized protein n=1 Tax=Jatropha curcas TaxID=180498 RepID=A0A067KWV9_JATCU|nr:hypothetical protein JCGZ_04147 [Jatropha curcas]
MRPYLLTLNGYLIPYRGFQEPFRCPTAKKMLPGLEIFSDVWGNKPETITELEVEDFMQPSLLDEVAVITGSEESRPAEPDQAIRRASHQLVCRGGARC